MRKYTSVMIETVLFVLLIAVFDLFITLPLLLAHFLNPLQFLHCHPTSDTPGNPHVFDDAMKSLFRTLPEPSDFNIIWTSVPIGREPLIIRGRKIPGRIHSITIYNAYKMTDLPISFDLEQLYNQFDEFEIILIKDDSIQTPLRSGSKLVSLKGWSHCIISFRNYLVPPGVTIATPSLTYLNDPSVVLRPSEILVSGPAALNQYQRRRDQVYYTKMTILNALGASVMHWILNFSELQTAILLVISGTIAFTCRQLCFVIGKYALRRMMTKITKGVNHKFFYPSALQNSQASQPSALHKYWAMAYDLTNQPKDAEVQIKGQIVSDKQKYWSVIVYNEYGLSLSSYVHDESVKKNIIKLLDNGSEMYSYDIRLVSHSSNVNRRLEAGVTQIDVSSSKRGYVLFRLVHPLSEDAIQFSTPSSELLHGNMDHSKTL